MLVEIAIGDAFGAGREYAPAADVSANNDGKTYVQHLKWKDLTPGRYTDDTQMTIGLVNFMLSGLPPTAYNLAFHFLRAFKDDPRAGYAGKFYEILKKTRNANDLLRTLQPQSDRSGGAMRACPAGLLPTVAESIDFAMWQASLTHATKDGMGAAGATAAMVWACRQGCDRGYLPQFLTDVLPGFNWGTPWTGPVGAPGLHSVKAALAAIVDHDNLHDILRASVAFTGDVDTVAAISMGAASMHPNIERNLQPSLYAGLEPTGKFGTPFLTNLNAKLMAKYPARVAPAAESEQEPPDPPAPDQNILDLFA